VTSGTVLHVGWFAGSYASNPWWISPSFAGYTYVVDHGSFIGIYGHCMDGGARVSNGQYVTEGQILGLSGNTGASTGDHLHFEILPDGYVLNSYMYGRINPELLFGSGAINTKGDSITPIVQEDDLSAAEVQQILNHIDNTSMADRLWMQADNEARELVTRKDIVRDVVTALSSKIDGVSLDLKTWEQGDSEARHLATRKEVDEARDEILARLKKEAEEAK
jgi:hypothetical protein